MSRMEGFDFRGDYRDEDHLQDYEPAANESPKCDKRDLLVSSILRYSRCDFQDLCTPGSPGSSFHRFLLQALVDVRGNQAHHLIAERVGAMLTRTQLLVTPIEMGDVSSKNSKNPPKIYQWFPSRAMEATTACEVTMVMSQAVFASHELSL